VNIACPACERVYRIDPVRVPDDGARTRCERCGASFLVVASPEANRPGVAVTGEPAPDLATPPRPVQEPQEPQEPAVAPGAEATGAAEPDAPDTTPAPAEPDAPDTAPAPAEDPVRAPAGSGRAPSPAPAVPVFGPQDPQTRARRLARALISDIKVYNRDRWERSRSAGTLRRDFRDEILKSWEEYVEQVGEMAKQSPYFRDALNDILAAGERVF
jgi:predicted Zn finger-like uncharacterized protein